MKKYLLIIAFLLILASLFNANKIYAYSGDYLPGGKNYLTSENFVASGDYYINIDPFLVKPYTEYTLSIPRYYYDDEHPVITASYYNNATFVEDHDFIETDFHYDDVLQIRYISFTTGSNVNYISLRLPDYSRDIRSMGFDYFQLEEGAVPTTYEPYIQGSMIDTESPYFENTGTIISYVDSPITVAEIQSSLTAYDSIDGDVTGNISLVSDDYTANSDILGTYQIVFQAYDGSGNVSQVTIPVEVVDILKPVFTDIGTVKAVYPNAYTVGDILGMLSASDNYDGDISNLIQLVTDSYSANSDIVGTYDMTFSVSDSSGNTANYTLPIQVVDEDGPIISGTTSIVTGYDALISDDMIESNLSATDNYDSSDSLSFVKESDSYTANYNQLGNYEIVYSVTDSSGNKTSQVISISVVDLVSPVVYFNSAVIQVYNDTVLALPDFVDLLSKSNEIDGTKTYYITVKYDSYTKHAYTPGKYNLVFDIKDSQGKTYTKQIEVKVIEKPVDYIHRGLTVDVVQDFSFYDRYKNYIIGGGISAFIIIANVLWFFVIKKRH